MLNESRRDAKGYKEDGERRPEEIMRRTETTSSGWPAVRTAKQIGDTDQLKEEEGPSRHPEDFVRIGIATRGPHEPRECACEDAGDGRCLLRPGDERVNIGFALQISRTMLPSGQNFPVSMSIVRGDIE